MGLGKDILDAASLFDGELFNQRVQIDQALAAQKTNQLLQQQINDKNAKQLMSAFEQHRRTVRQENILRDPKLNKQIQDKRIELLEKTGVAVPINDIIDVYFSHLDDDGLTKEEAEELAAIQKQFEDEEEAKVDAEIAQQKSTKKSAKKSQEATPVTGWSTVIKIILVMIVITMIIIGYMMLAIPQ